MLRTLSFVEMPAARSRFPFRRSVSRLSLAFAAVAEGLAASRHYQQSLRRGTSHDAAVREAFGIGPARRHGVEPIYFAGRM